MTLGILTVGILYILLTIFMIFMFKWDSDNILSIFVCIIWAGFTILSVEWLYQNVDWTIKLF